MKLRFYKKENKWFADVPGIPEDLNEMVLNSDMLLEELSLGKTAVTLNIEVDEPKQYLIKMTIKEHDDEGAWYSLMGPLYNQVMTETATPFTEIWICNVTHAVLGEHPEAIYITSIERENYPTETWVDMVDLI